MKKKKTTILKVLGLCMAILTIGGWSNSFAASFSPQNLIIDTEKPIIGIFGYDDFEVNTQKIVSEVGVGYCLEIDKDYPTGQNFINEAEVGDPIKRVLANGYPNKTAAELGLDSENDAYFATQVALWSVIEGYDINKITTANPKILKVIVDIYQKAQNTAGDPLKYGVRQYYTSDTVQRVSVINVNEVNAAPQMYNLPTNDNNADGRPANGLGNGPVNGVGGYGK